MNTYMIKFNMADCRPLLIYRLPARIFCQIAASVAAGDLVYAEVIQDDGRRYLIRRK